jgi:hypothetical protein
VPSNGLLYLPRQMEAGASHLVAVLAADSVDIDSALALMASVIGDSSLPLDSIYLTPSFRSRMYLIGHEFSITALHRESGQRLKKWPSYSLWTREVIPERPGRRYIFLAHVDSQVVEEDQVLLGEDVALKLIDVTYSWPTIAVVLLRHVSPWLGPLLATPLFMGAIYWWDSRRRRRAGFRG